MNAAVETVSQTLARKLGDQLQAIYLFGSAAQPAIYLPDQSDINLFLVLADGTSIHQVREIFQSIWPQHQQTLKRAPFVAQRHAFLRHIQINPALAYHLSRVGQQPFGDPALLDNHLPQANPNELVAYPVASALQASAALMPGVLDEETAVSHHTQLHRLARQLRREPIPAQETAVQRFARIQHYLKPFMDRLPATQNWASAAQSGPTSPLLPGLQAIYTETGKTILVFARLTPQLIVQIDWPKLARRVPHHNNSIHVTTVAQLCLITMFEKPLDLTLKKYQHVWGVDFLSALTPSNRQVLRHAARIPSGILIDSLPHAYLTQTDSSDQVLHQIIHDFQNRMLNVQLEHELLVRFGIVPERFVPPEPVPDRDTAPLQRINAIFQHLEWWTDFYASTLSAA